MKTQMKCLACFVLGMAVAMSLQVSWPADKPDKPEHHGLTHAERRKEVREEFQKGIAALNDFPAHMPLAD